MDAKFALTLLVVLTVSNSSFARAEDKVIEVKGKAVVFFGPTEKECKSLSENEQNEWNEVLSDFYHYRDNTISFLESHKIKPIITANTKIVIHTGTRTQAYIRKNIKHIVGYILTDGTNEPKVVDGVGTDVDLIMDFKAYFKIK